MVTDLGWYAELPEGTVFRVDPEDEAAGLQRLLRQLAADPAKGRPVATAGRARLEAAHTPALYARAVADIARRFESDAAKRLQNRQKQQGKIA